MGDPRPTGVVPGAASAPSDNAAPAATAEDAALVEALRRGDEDAFMRLVERYHGALVRLALAYVADRAVAEEVAQETWLSVLRGIGRFEGRSSLKTWIFRILVNTARTRAQREGRSIPFSAVPDLDADVDEPTADADRFLPADHPHSPGRWASAPRSWEGIPEERLLSRETREHLAEAIASLPPSQRAVITLRDVEGWSPEEACAFLHLSEGNQRVLLHRARARVRRALECYFDEWGTRR